MGSRRRRRPGGPARGRLLIADAGMLAGFRQARPTLDQLDAALADLRAHDDLTVVVLADSALKRELATREQDRFESYRGDGTLVCAAAGSEGGHTGFMKATATKACDKAVFDDVLVLTARDIGSGRWNMVTLVREDDRWTIRSSSPTRVA